MQARQFHAVVIAVGRADDGVDVKRLRQGVAQKHAGMMVALDDRNRALDAVVERSAVVGAADPAEMGLVQVPFGLAHAGGQRTCRQLGKVGGAEVEQAMALRAAETGRCGAFAGVRQVIAGQSDQLRLLTTIMTMGIIMVILVNNGQT